MPKVNISVKDLAQKKDAKAMYEALKAGCTAFRSQFRAGMAMCIG